MLLHIAEGIDDHLIVLAVLRRSQLIFLHPKIKISRIFPFFSRALLHPETHAQKFLHGMLDPVNNILRIFLHFFRKNTKFFFSSLVRSESMVVGAKAFFSFTTRSISILVIGGSYFHKTSIISSSESGRRLIVFFILLYPSLLTHQTRIFLFKLSLYILSIYISHNR